MNKKYEVGLYANQGRLFRDGRPMTNDQIIDGLKERDRLQRQSAGMVKRAYHEGWELGWVTRNMAIRNESRVSPDFPPPGEVENAWANSEAKAALPESSKEDG